jgi:hypothetical protein
LPSGGLPPFFFCETQKDLSVCIHENAHCSESAKKWRSMLNAYFEFAYTNHLRVISCQHRQSVLLPFISLLDFGKKSLYTANAYGKEKIVAYWKEWFPIKLRCTNLQPI